MKKFNIGIIIFLGIFLGIFLTSLVAKEVKYNSYDMVDAYESEIFDNFKYKDKPYLKNKNHITFVNQTNSVVKFKIASTKKENKKDTDANNDDTYIILNPKTSNYINVGDKRCGKRHITKKGKIKDNRNWITIKAVSKGHPTLKFQRRCGEDFYMWGFDLDTTTGWGPNKYSVRHDLGGTNDKYNEDNSKDTILFAHGYTASQEDWSAWKKVAKEQDWRVFGTSVSGFGSMMKRAEMLAKYINSISDLYNIPDRTIVAVGHSMGGLDLRYLISNAHRLNREYNSDILLRAAKKIKSVYTLSTPHRGSKLSYGTNQALTKNRRFPYGKPHNRDDAAHALEPTFMKKFNKKYSYKSFKNFSTNIAKGRKIPFLALRFKCKGFAGDGAVNPKRQSLYKAPMTEEVQRARHDAGEVNYPGWYGGWNCTKEPEIQKTENFLLDILKDAKEEDKIKSIVAPEKPVGD